MHPITLHKYLYANGNPVNGIDPSGLFTLAEVSAARQVRNTLAQAQLYSYMKLVRHTDSDGLGGQVSSFIDKIIGFVEDIQFALALKFFATSLLIGSTGITPKKNIFAIRRSHKKYNR
jgi:hypothetical protein